MPLEALYTTISEQIVPPMTVAEAQGVILFFFSNTFLQIPLQIPLLTLHNNNLYIPNQATTRLRKTKTLTPTKLRHKLNKHCHTTKLFHLSKNYARTFHQKTF